MDSDNLTEFEEDLLIALGEGKSLVSNRTIMEVLRELGEAKPYQREIEDACAEITRLRGEVDKLAKYRFAYENLVADLATTEMIHDCVYETWVEAVRHASPEMQKVIRDVSDPEEGWRWDNLLPKAGQ